MAATQAQMSFRLRTTRFSVSRGRAYQFDRSVIIAVVAIGVMQMAFHQVIDVIAMRDGFVTAARSVLMRRLVASAGMLWRAIFRVLLADLQRVLIHMILM
jgi:hypothetical protein